MRVSQLHLVADGVPRQRAFLDDRGQAFLLRVEPDLIAEQGQVFTFDEIIDLAIVFAYGTLGAILRMTSVECNDEHLGCVRIVITSDHHLRLVGAEKLLPVELKLWLQKLAYRQKSGFFSSCCFVLIRCVGVTFFFFLICCSYQAQLFIRAVVRAQVFKPIIELTVFILAPHGVLEDELAVLRCQDRVRIVVICCEHGRNAEAALRLELVRVVKKLILNRLQNVHA